MRLGIFTSGRQDWGCLRSTWKLLAEDPAFDAHLLAGGMHLSPAHGSTIDQVRTEAPLRCIEVAWLVEGSGVAQAASVVGAMGGALDRLRPEALLVLGDRMEAAATALAATLLRVPIVHLHGGEETSGAFDDALRHAVTKMAHLHLVSHETHARRVMALGEDPGSVHVVGAPGLDNLHRDDLPGRDELERALGLVLEPPVVLVTVHPTTLALDPAAEARAVSRAMDAVPATYVVTLPNCDPGSEEVRTILASSLGRPRRAVASALGERRYWGLLRIADAVLGNSSSALIEAPAVALPAVNVGDRQSGRLRGTNVLDAPADAPAIVGALRRALDPAFRASLRGSPALFGDGHSAERIVGILRNWQPPVPPRKPPVRVSP